MRRLKDWYLVFWPMFAALAIATLLHDLGVFLLHGVDATYWINWK